MIAFKGGAGEPSDMRLPGKAGGAVAVRRTLASTICWITGPTHVPRPRQLRDASTVMRFRPAHQSVINRRHDDRACCPARQNLEQALERKPRTRLPATWNGGHESGECSCTECKDRLAALPGRPSRFRCAEHPAATAAGTKPSRNTALCWNG